AAAQRLDDHLLLDRRAVRPQRQLADDRGPDRPEAVLALGETDAEPPVDAGRNQRAPRQPKELVEAAVQLARAAHEARARNVIGRALEDWRDEPRDVVGIVRAVGVEYN